MHKYFSTGQYKNTIKTVHERCNYHKIPVPTLTFKGTVKLHGTNSSVYNVLSNDELVVQSKNNVITPEADNAGFANYVKANESLFKEIFNQVKKQYPDAVENKTAVIYGEWCGGSIQKGVALSGLPKMFVVFAMKLTDNKEQANELINTNSEDNEEEINQQINIAENEQWFFEEQIRNVLEAVDKEKLQKIKLFNVFDFETFEVTVDMTNPKLTQNQIIEYTNQVEKECPVGKVFGVSGIGEGIVWRCITVLPELNTQDLVFKVKGEKHSVSKVKTIAEVDEVKLNSIKEFVDAVVTENRLQQGLDYLKEQNLEVIPQNMGPFLKWLANDCLKEESGMMEASKLDKKEVMPSISNKAKQWFLVQIGNQARANVTLK